MSPLLADTGGLSANAYGMFGLQAPDGFNSIATVTVGVGGQSSVTFSSIPSGYKHLQIRSIALAASGSVYVNCNMQFNGDTAANYSYHGLFGNGSTAGTQVGLASTSITSVIQAGVVGSPGIAASVIDILDYSNTNKYKTTRALTGIENNSAGYVYFNSGNWRSTTGITSITITPSSSSFSQYSSFALYGIK